MSSLALSTEAAGPARGADVVVLDGARLDPDAVVRVARRHARAGLDAGARERNLRAREAIAALLERGEPLYGASTGVGALRERPVAVTEREPLQWNLLRSHAVDAGPPLPDEVVRAAMVVRANQLGAGGAGVAAELLDGLVAALEWEQAPVVGSLGGLGTGDLPGLARIAVAVLEARGPDEPLPRLGLRDALGFMSSNALTLGRACLLWHDVRELLNAWLVVGGLSFEATGADPVVFATCVQAAAGEEGQLVVAARMRAALGVDDRGRASGGPVQGAYPFRVLPQVDGVTWEAVQALGRVLARGVNGRGENALIDGGRAWPNGNFHAAALTAALDALRGALAGSAGLIAARVSALLDPAQSGLEPFLAGTPGRDSGMMMIEYTAHGAAAEIRSLAAAASAQAISVSLGVESHASFAPLAAARLADMVAPLRTLVATELVVARRALQLRGARPAGPGTAALYDAAGAALPGGIEDRDFGAEVRLAERGLPHWAAAAAAVA